MWDATLETCRCSSFWGKWGTKQSRLITGREQEWLWRDRDKVVNRTWPSWCVRKRGPSAGVCGVSAMSSVCTYARKHMKMCMHLAGIYFCKFDSIPSVSFQMWLKLFNSLINSPPYELFSVMYYSTVQHFWKQIFAVGMNSSLMCSMAHLFYLLVLEKGLHSM